MAATSILMAGMFVALYTSSQALSPSLAANAVVDASIVLSDLVSELQLAVDFAEQTPTTVTFLLADRNGDGISESIRYAWSGLPGAPLLRKYNDAPERTILASIHDFHLEYDIVTIVPTTATSPSATNHTSRVCIELQPTELQTTRIRTTASVFNRPEVSTP